MKKEVLVISIILVFGILFSIVQFNLTGNVISSASSDAITFASCSGGFLGTVSGPSTIAILDKNPTTGDFGQRENYSYSAGAFSFRIDQTIIPGWSHELSAEDNEFWIGIYNWDAKTYVPIIALLEVLQM